MVNIHHLELFYYVARHGGISEAVRNMPYGIQQPAISAQIIQLEESLGVTLFQRRPFQLTTQGVRLFEFTRPFFENVEAVAAELRGGAAQHIRIGASGVVLRDYLPIIGQGVRQKFPRLHLTLREGYHPDLVGLLQKGDIDLAITLVHPPPNPPIQYAEFLRLPLALVLPKKSRLNSAADLWKRDRIDETLICLPPAEQITRLFLQELTRLGVDWFPGITVSSLEVLDTYVATGYGYGVSVELPIPRKNPGVRTLPLPGFPEIAVGALWCGECTPLMTAFIDATREHAQRLCEPPSPSA